MKFKYILILLFFPLPILKCIADYNYSQTVNKERIQFKVLVWDYEEKNRTVDTLYLSIQFHIPKYYTVKKYNFYGSDCLTCDHQGYTFFKNPALETIQEPDSLKFGWISPVDTNRGIDSVIFSVVTINDIFLQDYPTRNKTNERQIRQKKIVAMEIMDYKIVKDILVDSDNGYTILQVDSKQGMSHSSYNSQFNLIRFSLIDKTKNPSLSKDYYRIISSIKIGVSYYGQNKKLINLIHNY